MTFSLPYALVVSDGVTMRTVHPAALGRHRPAIEAALADVMAGPKSPPPTAEDPRGSYLPLAAAPAASTRREPPKLDTIQTQGEIARAQGYTGDACTGCGGFTMRRNGTCLLCTSCGTTTGCS